MPDYTPEGCTGTPSASCGDCELCPDFDHRLVTTTTGMTMTDSTPSAARAAAEEILRPDYSLQRDGHLLSYLHQPSDVCTGYPYKCVTRKKGKNKPTCPLSYMKYDEGLKLELQHCDCYDMAFEMAIQRLAAIIERHCEDAAP